MVTLTVVTERSRHLTSGIFTAFGDLGAISRGKNMCRGRHGVREGGEEEKARVI